MNPSRDPSSGLEDEGTSLSPEVRDIDAALDEHFAFERRAAADVSSADNASLVARILDATRDELVEVGGPYRFVDAPRGFRAVAGGALAAAVLVIVGAPLVWMLSSGSSGGSAASQSRMASVAPIDFEVFGGPRESEVMLAAVLDPDDEWFEDLTYQTDPGLDVGTILETRSFDIVDLEDDLVAIMRHSTS